MGTEERLLVCNCQRTMEIDGKALARALDLPEPLSISRELCRAELATFERAISGGGPVRVACTQEAALFAETAAGKDEGSLRFTNIRERAGWCSAKADALPKIAALLAEATVATTPAPLLTLTSQGQCLVYGRGAVALEAARTLAGRLAVTLLLVDPADATPPMAAPFPVARGRIKSLKGHLGSFELEVDGYAPALPSSRAHFEFAMARDGARSRCDLVVDLSGGSPLITDRRRDGYLRADPASPAGVAATLLAAVDLVGEFEKPRYVAHDPALCAHARSGKVGCRNCLDACPTGAIRPDGDHVAIDPHICGGCGQCGSLCPTGSATYAYPRPADLVRRIEALIGTYLRAGGQRPILLLHDNGHGLGVIDAMARFGRGLPTNVLPLSLHSASAVGHETILAALVQGAEQVVVLIGRQHPEEHTAIRRQIELAAALLSGLGLGPTRVHLLIEDDPEVIEGHLYSLPPCPQLPRRAVSPTGSKREWARMALTHLREQSPAPPEVIPLPPGAPYGRMVVDTAGCTLCLSCVGACPVGALGDHPDRPQLSFTESACVQCGICVATCPEKVIRLEPRMSFASAALSPHIVKGEEPFACISCGKLFGVRSSIERVVERLKGHAMFRDERQLRLLQMCDTCRVVAVTEEAADPMRFGERPRVRTTEDYIAEDLAAANNKSDKRDPRA